MKKTATKFATMSLALIMGLSIASGALAGNPPPVDTQASVKFTAGGIIIDPNPDPDLFPEVSPMALEFGNRPIPSKVFTYTADGDPSGTADMKSTAGSHTAAKVGVQVTDQRTTNGGWTYSVKLGPFKSSDPLKSDFNVELNMTNPAVDSSNQNAASLAGLTGGAVKLDTTNATNSSNALTATSAVGRGKHIVFWENTNIKMTLNGDDFHVIDASTYAATMTWSLQVL